jgi:hypothetical protein
MLLIRIGGRRSHRFLGCASFSMAGEVASTPRVAAGALLADSEAVLGAGFAMLAAATLPFAGSGDPSASSARIVTIRGAAGCCRLASRFRLGGETMAPAPAVC